MRYCNAFQYERAAYSVLGSVLCSSGILSFWRKEVIKNNINDYLCQTFLGSSVIAGDDRHLTFYALREGKVVFQETAKSKTLVPENLVEFAKQQMRWNKSFFRETLYLLRNYNIKKVAWWLSLGELSIWIIFSLSFLIILFVKPVIGGRIIGVYYLGYLSLMAYARSIRYINENFFIYLLSPVYGLIHMSLLVPLRFYSLITIRNCSWETRNINQKKKGVKP